MAQEIKYERKKKPQGSKDPRKERQKRMKREQDRKGRKKEGRRGRTKPKVGRKDD